MSHLGGRLVEKKNREIYAWVYKTTSEVTTP